MEGNGQYNELIIDMTILEEHWGRSMDKLISQNMKVGLGVVDGNVLSMTLETCLM